MSLQRYQSLNFCFFYSLCCLLSFNPPTSLLKQMCLDFWHHNFSGLQISSNVTIHMPFQEHISFWLDGVKLYNFHFSSQNWGCAFMRWERGTGWGVTLPVLHKKMNSWALNALMTAPYLLMLRLTSKVLINESASLPQSGPLLFPSVNWERAARREHLVFLSSLDESFDGNVATKRISDCVTCSCVWRSISGSWETLWGIFYPEEEKQERTAKLLKKWGEKREGD